MRAAQAKTRPLEFLKLLAHDIRWRILLALSRSDHRVEELVKQIKQPHNLISYHLKRLRLQQLVTERRSSADARDIYYSLNLDRFRQMYSETGQALHPGVSEPVSMPQPQTKAFRKLQLACCFYAHITVLAPKWLRDFYVNWVTTKWKFSALALSQLGFIHWQ